MQFERLKTRSVLVRVRLYKVTYLCILWKCVWLLRFSAKCQGKNTQILPTSNEEYTKSLSETSMLHLMRKDSIDANRRSATDWIKVPNMCTVRFPFLVFLKQDRYPSFSQLQREQAFGLDISFSCGSDFVYCESVSWNACYQDDAAETFFASYFSYSALFSLRVLPRLYQKRNSNTQCSKEQEQHMSWGRVSSTHFDVVIECLELWRMMMRFGRLKSMTMFGRTKSLENIVDIKSAWMIHTINVNSISLESRASKEAERLIERSRAMASSEREGGKVHENNLRNQHRVVLMKKSTRNPFRVGPC